MNVANPQLEGVLMATASINHIWVQKACFRSRRSTRLRKAEASGASEERSEELSLATRDAINFPIRLLHWRVAGRAASVRPAAA
jgi:hypothetical protein